MKLENVTIGIKGASLEDVNSLLKNSYMLSVFNSLNANITVDDLRGEFVVMSNFLKENNLQDENDFFNDFDIDPYGLKVDINMVKGQAYFDVIEVVCFLWGKQISLELKTECIIMYDNFRVPVGLFREGVLADSFEKYNSDYFADRIWKPNTVR